MTQLEECLSVTPMLVSTRSLRCAFGAQAPRMERAAARNRNLPVRMRGVQDIDLREEKNIVGVFVVANLLKKDAFCYICHSCAENVCCGRDFYLNQIR